MDTKHFIRVFRPPKLLKHKQLKVLLKSSPGHLSCSKRFSAIISEICEFEFVIN